MKCYFLAVVLTAASAFGQVDPRVYFRGDIGPAITEDADAGFFPGAGSVTLDLDPGMRFSVAGGAMFGDFFGLELETGWMFNEIDSISGFDDADGFLSQAPFLVNAVFQIKNPSGITPFIGAGAGGTAVSIYLDDAVAGLVEVDGSAGLKYEINNNLSVGVIYKYFWSDDGEWEVEDSVQDIEFEGTRTHSISAVVSYSF